MSVTKLLIANRGEIAIRIARAAADMALTAVAVYSVDDARSLHTRVADEVQALPGQGPAAYMMRKRSSRRPTCRAATPSILATASWPSASTSLRPVPTPG